MAIGPIDSLDERIRRAIAEKRLLRLRYKSAVRLAEPHDYGVLDGTGRLLIFQLRGRDPGKSCRRLALARYHQARELRSHGSDLRR